MDVNFGIQSYKQDAGQLSSQRLINGYAEIQPKDAKSKIAVFGAPGITTWCTAGSGPYRGGVVIDSVPYVVSGQELYSIDEDGVPQLRGNGITGISRVGIDGSLTEVVLVNGLNGFSYLISTESFAQISDSDFIAANTVTCINNRFVEDEAGTNFFQVSDILDGRNYLGDEAAAEANPDKVLAVGSRNSTLYLFGEKSIEAWDNTGASDFPFSRFNGATIDRGIRAIHALVKEDQSFFFLGNDLVAYRFSGAGLQRISTHALEKEWQTYTTTSDAFMFNVGYGGHKFIGLTFPTMNRTVCFDIASGLWHDRASYDPSGLVLKWRVGGALEAYDKVLVGDLNSGRVGYLDPNTFTEFGDQMLLSVVSAPLFAKGKKIFVPKFEVDIEAGVGLTTGQGSDPMMMMSYSTDGGSTWTAPEEAKAMGKIGEKTTRLQWDRLGSAYQWTFKLSVSDPVKRVITGARCPGAYTGD